MGVPSNPIIVGRSSLPSGSVNKKRLQSSRFLERVDTFPSLHFGFASSKKKNINDLKEKILIDKFINLLPCYSYVLD